MSGTLVVEAVSVSTTFGAAFIGLVAGAVLFGVTLLQTYEYYKRYPQDSFHMKLMVAVLTALDTLHLVLCTKTIYWYLITNYNRPDNLDNTTWSMALQTDCNGIIGLIVECFFARRVWLMSKNWPLVVIIVVLATLHFGLGVVFTAESFILGHFSKFQRLTWVTCTGLGAAAVSDILIALSMCYYLQKKRTGIERTDDLVTTLMLYSINTGLLTSIIATTAVILFAVMPTNFLWLCFFWIMGKCYVNSVLASLNSRDRLRQKVYSSGVNITPSPGGRIVTDSSHNFRDGPILLRRVSNPAPKLAVAVETTTEYKTDYPDSSQTASVNSPSTPKLGNEDSKVPWVAL
ncbi:hypothetical protein QCA50_007003 [Cerrena zonata]|uniref:DUF6534 domain-containing protein n=1 Tax=Cerrena zonata TaxID=2478898 RepID=A0AAW0GL90_9APHY